MEKKNINIFFDNKILFENISNKNEYFQNLNFIYLDINNCKKEDFKNNKINIFFLPLLYKLSKLKNLFFLINDLNPNKTIICCEKKISSKFSNNFDNLLSIPLSFDQLFKKINLLKISSDLKFLDLFLTRQNNILKNINNNLEVELTFIESNILIILINSKKPVAKKEINFRGLGHTKEIDSHSLDSHIYRLRKKIAKIKSQSKIVAKKSGFYQIV